MSVFFLLSEMAFETHIRPESLSASACAPFFSFFLPIAFLFCQNARAMYLPIFPPFYLSLAIRRDPYDIQDVNVSLPIPENDARLRLPPHVMPPPLLPS